MERWGHGKTVYPFGTQNRETTEGRREIWMEKVGEAAATTIVKQFVALYLEGCWWPRLLGARVDATRRVPSSRQPANPPAILALLLFILMKIN